MKRTLCALCFGAWFVACAFAQAKPSATQASNKDAQRTSAPAVVASAAAPKPDLAPLSARAALPLRQRILGTWKLVSTEQKTPEGEAHPFPNFGAHPIGFLVYSADGYVCFEMMNPERPRPVAGHELSEEEKKALVDDFASFCGTWELNEKDSIMIHRPQTSWNPALIGLELHRSFVLEGDRLIFHGTGAQSGVTSTITWERVQ